MTDATSPTLFRERRTHHIFFVLVALALALRLLFWLYTQRIWEDALISLTPARNVWEGYGLTHHASEPRVHSFTSALGEIVLIAGEGFGHGLLAMRLASLACAAAAIYYVYRTGLLLGMSAAGFLFVGGFLAADHLQIFFGMSGMETQIATAVLLAGVYYLVSRQWFRLGLACGLAVICRPEFLLWVGCAGMVVLSWHRDHLRRVATGAALAALPWLSFATLYYGSPIPNTIFAKQAATRSGFFSAGTEEVLKQLSQTWRHLAPFTEFWATARAPVPEGVLMAIVALVLALAAVGAVQAIRRDRAMWAPLAALVLFFAYRTTFTISPYYMWYMPPFMALLMFFAACGLSWLARPLGAGPATALASALLAGYAMHLPFTLPLDRAVQRDIEEGVRARVGRSLDRLMGPQDSAVMEPLGYTGWYARNKTIWDFPGLSSPRAMAVMRRHPDGGISAIVRALQPTVLVLRPQERADLNHLIPGLFARYQAVQHIRSEEPITLEHWGLAYWVMDNEFTIFRRRR